MSLHCVAWDTMSCSDQASPMHCIPCEHAGGKNKNQGLALLTMFHCSGVTAPGVDHNGVILLSVAASLTLTDNFSSALVYHSSLSWHTAECFPN